MNSGDAFNTLVAQQGQAQNPNDILTAQRQQLGVNAANDTVTGLRGAIDNTTKLLKQVAPGVMGRTANSLVTSGQANRIIQNESAPISATLGDESNKYNQANEDYSKLESQAEQASQGIYQGQQDKLSYAQNLYNTLYGREQDDRAATQAEADKQEQIRQFNASLTRASSSGGGSSGGSKSSGSSSDDVTKIDAYLKPQLGKDGYASPYDYNDAKSAWAQDGLSPVQFEAIFGKYKNPKTKGYS